METLSLWYWGFTVITFVNYFQTLQENTLFMVEKSSFQTIQWISWQNKDHDLMKWDPRWRNIYAYEMSDYVLVSAFLSIFHNIWTHVTCIKLFQLPNLNCIWKSHLLHCNGTAHYLCRLVWNCPIAHLRQAPWERCSIKAVATLLNQDRQAIGSQYFSGKDGFIYFTCIHVFYRYNVFILIHTHHLIDAHPPSQSQ